MKSELVKQKNPITSSFNRDSYYIKTKFEIENKPVRCTLKLDSGYAFTIIGLDNELIKPFNNTILRSNMKGIAYDASGKELPLYGYVVNNFRISNDIKFDRIKIFFCKEMGVKAVLGMDILSLFDFQYLKEKRQNYGTFWINDYEQVLKDLPHRQLNQNLDYIDPVLIALIDNMPDSNEYMKHYTAQDILANHVNNIIKGEV